MEADEATYIVGKSVGCMFNISTNLSGLASADSPTLYLLTTFCKIYYSVSRCGSCMFK